MGAERMESELVRWNNQRKLTEILNFFEISLVFPATSNERRSRSKRRNSKVNVWPRGQEERECVLWLQSWSQTDWRRSASGLSCTHTHQAILWRLRAVAPRDRVVAVCVRLYKVWNVFLLLSSRLTSCHYSKWDAQKDATSNNNNNGTGINEIDPSINGKGGKQLNRRVCVLTG